MDRKKQLFKALAPLGIQGQEAEGLIGLLDFINAPEDLFCLAAVLENVIAALELPLIKDVASDTKLVQQALEYRSKAYFLIERLQKHRERGHLFRPVETNVRLAMHTYIGRRRVYVLLFMTSEKNQHLYRAFQQILLFLPALIAKQTAQNTAVCLTDGDLKQLSEIFREFSQETPITDWYSTLSRDTYQSLSHFIERMKPLKAHLKKLNYNKKLRQIIRLDIFIRILGLGLGIPRPRKSSKGRERGSSPHKASEIDGYTALTGEMLVALTLPDIHDDEDLVYALWESPVDTTDYESIYSGEDEQEQETGDVYIFQTAQPLESYVQAFHGKLVSRAILNRISRQNNYLPLSLQMLSPYEYQLLLKTLSTPPDTKDTLILQLILLTMLYTASPFERAREVLFANRFSDNEIPVNIGYEYSTHSWVIPALNLHYKTPGDISGAPKATNILRLPASSLCRLRFEELATKQMPTETPQSPCNKTNVLVHEIHDYIKNIGNGTLTKGRISNHLLIHCCAIYGQATTALLFNREPPGSMARSYYTSLHITLLQQRYNKLMDILIATLGRPFDAPQPAEHPGWIGARYRPEMEQVAAAIATMKTNLAHLQTRLIEPGTWIEFHNLYVTYQVLCQTLLTGMRPIQIPLVKREQLILSVGVFVRKEKAREDEFNTRHIPICQTMLELLNDYDRHMLIVKSRLLRKNFQLSSLPELFYLEANGQPQQFQPLLYQRELNRYIELPPNLNRRLLRNYLEEQAVSHEVIDVALGHANIGEQYWGAHSTLSMREIREQLASPMALLAKRLGIKTMAGLPA
ncbi:MAG TPA: hypothetical protein DF774_08295 [Rheinheimera sp.]|uniref:hypothetical protein n=1 Tax=Rheinheimera sp. TaxID=1869214 RepID=UPI000EE765BF|nr:hypothetical protein [Rheinheimera sp.]HCU65744.1 hypothetical protein [Rheinheimera sp.]